jgi:predicted GIY-YIG superfamily endonuclease
MSQMLLIPDPRPLVEQLGAKFFQDAPETPGVYLMRDAADSVVYVGKAKNLRKRLGNYRVANPERMPRRHLRMLRLVARIELQECENETAALSRESELLLSLRPRFNRAGTWKGPTRFLAWRLQSNGLELAVESERKDGWDAYGPLGAGAFHLRAALVRLVWCAIHAELGIGDMPAGWITGRSHRVDVLTISSRGGSTLRFAEAAAWMDFLFKGDASGFAGWMRERTATRNHSLERAIRESDLEAVCEFVRQKTERGQATLKSVAPN